MSPSSKRKYRTPPRLAERPAGALTFAEISSLPSFRGVSASTLRNWLADGGLGRLPAPERGRGATVYDAAFVAALVARGRPRARARRAVKPRYRTRAGVAKVGYDLDEGWATCAELARRHGLPRSSALVTAVTRWNRAVTADRDALEALGAALGPELPALAAVLPIDSRIRIVDGRRCRTYRAARIALAVAQDWEPSHQLPWREWAWAAARAHVRARLPEEVFEDLVQTLVAEARGEADRRVRHLEERMEAIAREWCAGGAAPITARLDERHALAKARGLHGEALRRWCAVARQAERLTSRDELVVLHLIGAPRHWMFAATGLGHVLARHALDDLASHESPTRARDWRSFLADLRRATAADDERAKPAVRMKDSVRVLALLRYAEAARRSTHIVRALGAAAIAEALALARRSPR